MILYFFFMGRDLSLILHISHHIEGILNLNFCQQMFSHNLKQ